MDPKEIDDLMARIEQLRTKQAEIETMQRQMAEQTDSVKHPIDAEAALLKRIRLGPVKPDFTEAE